MELGQQAQASAISKATCECCSLIEECTEAYIKFVRDLYSGRWICGLCAEAVKGEQLRSSEDQMVSNLEAALNQHMSVCRNFKTSLTPSTNPTEDLIFAVKRLLLRSLDSSAR